MKKLKHIYYSTISINTDFKKLFFSKEYNSLTEEFGLNFLTIVFILFLTFFTLSFSIGSKEYLEQRMNNPFTNWVDVPVTMDMKNRKDDILRYFNQDSIKDELNLNNISEYKFIHRSFYSNDLKDVYPLRGRTLQSNSDLFKKILNIDNLIKKIAINEIEDIYNNCGIIVTEDFIKTLKYEKKNIPQYIFYENDNELIPLSIAGVVKFLPNNTDYIISKNFEYISQKYSESGFISMKETVNIVSIISTQKILKEFQNKLENKNFLVQMIMEEEIPGLSNEYLIYKIIFSQPYSYTSILKTIDKINDPEQPFRIFTKSNCMVSSKTFKNPHRLAFNFHKLDKVRLFKNKMNNKFKIDINMAQIEAKENFSIVSNLTFVLSLILFIFSLVSIIFFINSILTKHLQKISENIGTFKAFGLSNNKLLSIYMKIIFTFLIVSGSIAYFLTCLISIIFNYFSDRIVFKFYSPYILIVFILIILFSLLNSKFSISKVVKKTPGNLIYNRK